MSGTRSQISPSAMTAPRSENPSGAEVMIETIGMFSTNVRRISEWNPFMTAKVMLSTATPMAMPAMAVTLPRLRKRLCRRLRR